jgi:hypothetical protein
MKVEICEACGVEADDLIAHGGAFFCPSLHRCDYNANIGWINTDIQAGIDAELRRER